MRIVFTGIDPENPETWKNGGGRALLYLFNLLTMLGVECDINAPVGPDDVVIYPDCVLGNPCGAAKIVRYMLYFWPGERISKSECVICYHESYFDQVAQKYDRELPVENIVYLPTIEPGLFYPETKTLPTLCFRGKETVKEPPLDEANVFTKGSFSRQVLVENLRKCFRFSSMDHHTIMLTEAALCGCETFLVQEDRSLLPVKIENPEQHVMDAVRDIAQAQKFLNIVTEFFK